MKMKEMKYIAQKDIVAFAGISSSYRYKTAQVKLIIRISYYDQLIF